MSRETLLAVVVSGAVGLTIGSGALYWMVQKAAGGNAPQDAPAVVSMSAVDLCDELAAHPQDPEATRPGVEDDAIDTDVVTTACEEAIRSDDREPRLRFQLARAYLQDGLIEPALEQLVAAGDQGHGGALAYLAEMYLDGVPGLEADPVLAKELLERAAEAEFEPARAMLAEFEEEAPEPEPAPAAYATTPVNTAPGPRPTPNYNAPEIVENVRAGNLDGVPFGELYTKQYLVNMAQNIAAACDGAHFNRRQLDLLVRQAAFTSVELTPEAGWNQIWGGFLQMGQVLQNPQATLERSVIAEQEAAAMPIEAMKDAYSLASVDECGTPAMERFTQNLRAYVNDEGAPRLSTQQVLGLCMQQARPTGVYDTQNFCHCFSGLMTRGAISRAQRKGLAADFWATAQDIMARDPAHYDVCTNGWNR
jgi:TPR repeat protein